MQRAQAFLAILHIKLRQLAQIRAAQLTQILQSVRRRRPAQRMARHQRQILLPARRQPPRRALRHDCPPLGRHLLQARSAIDRIAKQIIAAHNHRPMMKTDAHAQIHALRVEHLMHQHRRLCRAVWMGKAHHQPVAHMFADRAAALLHHRAHRIERRRDSRKALRIALALVQAHATDQINEADRTLGSNCLRLDCHRRILRIKAQAARRQTITTRPFSHTAPLCQTQRNTYNRRLFRRIARTAPGTPA